MKLQWHIFISIALFFFLTQLLLFPHIEIANTSPQLFLILLTYLSLNLAIPETFLVSFFLGIMVDMGSCERIGMFCLFFSIGSFIILKLRKETFTEEPLWAIALVFFIVLQCNFFHACTLFILNRYEFRLELILKIFLCAFYTAIISPFVFCFLDKSSLLKISQKL